MSTGPREGRGATRIECNIQGQVGQLSSIGSAQIRQSQGMCMHAALIKLKKIRPSESVLEEAFHDEAVVGASEQGLRKRIDHSNPRVRQKSPGLGNPRTRGETTAAIVGALDERSRCANLELHVLQPC